VRAPATLSPPATAAAWPRSWHGFPFDLRLGEGPRERDSAPERTPFNDFILYHGTSELGAERIISEARLRPDDLGVVGVTTTPGAAQSFSAIKRGPVLRLTICRAWLSEQLITHEIGGSGHDQFLIHPSGRAQLRSWEGVPPAALLTCDVVEIGDDRLWRVKNTVSAAIAS
jgi:hypothetical protein